MPKNLFPLGIVLSLLLAAGAGAATLGTVVPIGGHASDIALDEGRGVVYVANFTANRIEVVSTATHRVERSISVAAQPAALALSPDRRYLVVLHLSNFENPVYSITVLDLSGDGNQRQTFALDAAPLGVAFGNDGMALVATTTAFLLFNPASGETTMIDTISDVAARALPVPAPTFPRSIIRASMAASGDGRTIFGTLEPDQAQDKALVFAYSTATKEIDTAVWTAEPPLGPRVVSADATGSRFMTGWGLFHRAGFLLAQFPGSSGNFDIGSHAFDTERRRVYVQVAPATPEEEPEEVCSVVGGVQVCVTPQEKTPVQNAETGPPILHVMDWDNLTVRERFRLPENLTGRSVLSSSREVLYGTSDSGLMILPVGSMANLPLVAADKEDLLFTGSWCDRRTMTQEITIDHPDGVEADFTLTTTLPGVTFSPASGTTPATVKVSVDPSAFSSHRGTVSGLIEIQSSAAVNMPRPVRILINNREPNQRGTLINIPGKLSDLVADPVRNRFYVLREDMNEVLVYDAGNYEKIATLRTGNTPMSMAITRDNRYLITSADNSQVAHVFNLDTLEFEKYILFPPGHYPRSIAVSNSAVLATSRVAGPKHTVDRIYLDVGLALPLPTLGIYENDTDMQAVLSATPSGSAILMAEPTGRVMLYDANADTWVAARQDVKELSGAYAALSDDLYVAGNILMNKSLVGIHTFESSSGLSSGFAIVDGMGLRTTAPNSSSAGVIQRVDLSAPFSLQPARMSEAPLLPVEEIGGFVRTLVPLPNRNGILSLSTSGLTVLAWDYDAGVANPLIQKVVSKADGSKGVAPGGLISIFGSDLAPVSQAASEIPLPTILGDSCITVNGVLTPLIFVSPTEIRGQLPVDVSGVGTMVLRTPAGVSNTFTFNIQPVAPAVFRVPVEGWDAQMPTVVRAANNLIVTPSNPVHLDDWLVIFVTGLGATIPRVDSGMPGPEPPELAEVLIEPHVTLGGVKLPVAFAGLAPGQVGVYQINVHVPFKEVPTGMQIPLTISQGAYKTTVTVRVVE
ncbi:MAG: hypothetical protein ACM3S5_09800 [Rhodospirillales bacterium]